MRTHILLLTFLILLGGCGYKPVSHYARNVLGTKVNTSVNLSVRSPESSYGMTDLINEALVSHFKTSLAPKNEADTFIAVTDANYETTDLQKDDRGYTVQYRTTSTLDITLKNAHKTHSFKAMGVYDFAVTPSSVVSEAARIESLRVATGKAIDELIAKMAFLGYYKE